MESFSEPAYVPEAAAREWRSPALLGVLTLTGAGWLVFVALKVLPELRTALPPASGTAVLVVIALVPLLFLSSLYLLFARGSRAEARRLRLMIQALRSEQANMQAAIDAATDRIIVQRAQIAEGGAALGATGERVSAEMIAMGDAMRADLDVLARHAGALKQSTAVARADLALLLSDVPKAHMQTRELAAEIDTAARTALTHAETLTAQVGALATQSHEAKVLAEIGAAALSDGNERAAVQAGQAREAIAGATAALTDGVDAALERAHRATEGVRQGLAAQGAALEAFVGSAEQSISRSGEQAGMAAQARIAELEERVAALGALLEGQGSATRDVLDQLAAEPWVRCDSRFGAFGDHDEVLGRAEARLRALDAGARDLGEALPALLDGASLRLEAANETARDVAPQIRALAADAERAAGHLAGLSEIRDAMPRSWAKRWPTH